MAAVTSLAAQLQQLATPQTSILDQKRDRRSILFEPSEAAKYGRDVYYDIGRSGFDDLAKTDKRFAAFSETLFGPASKDRQRAVEDRELNTKLDEELEAFMLLLSPYLQKEAALKALEWLVYRYQVNEMNKRPLMMCVFPYYESALFTRVLQVVALSGDLGEWQWLVQCQKSARPLPKLSVFTQWAKKQVFRNFLADYLRKIMKVHTRQETPTIASSFYITTVLGGLGVTEVQEEHLASIVKSLQLCLTSQHPHLVSGTYLILAQLACKTHLSPTLLNSVVQLLIQTPPPTDDLTQPCLLTLLALAHHQELGGVAGETLAALGEKEALLGCLEGVARDKSVAALLCPFIVGYLSSLMDDKQKKVKKGIKMEKEEEKKNRRSKERKFNKLIELVASLPLSSSDAARVMWSVLEALSCHPGLLTLPGVNVAEAMRTLELSHPQGHSEATARLAAQQNDPKCGEKYRKVLQSLLLPSDPSQPHCFTQLLHTDESVRTAAVKGYLERLARGVEAKGEVTALHIRSMLTDDCPAIPCLALSTPQALQAMSPSLLADLCFKLLEREGNQWRKVHELSIAALSGTVAEQYDAKTRDMALSVCLPMILMPRMASDLQLAHNFLKSKLARHSAFLMALRQELGGYKTQGKVKDYNAKVWGAVPRIIAGLSATEQEVLWGLLEGQEGGKGLVVALGLLHAGLGTHGVKGEAALVLAHRMLDGCLALMETGRVSHTTEEHNWTEKQVTPSDLHTYIGQVTHYDLPCDLLVPCVLRAAGVFVLPPACGKTPYWTPFMEVDPGRGHLLLLVKVAQAALRLERLGVTAARDTILLKLLKECLPDAKSQLYFLALPWSWQTALPLSHLMDETLQTWTLKLGQSLLSRGTPLSWTLSPGSPLVPALLSALTSSVAGVRGAALECLRVLAAVPGAGLTHESVMVVVKGVVEREEEIVADGSQLAALFSGKGYQQKQAAQCLLGLVVGGMAPSHIKAALLYALSGATQPAILLNLVSVAEDLLTQAEIKSKKNAKKIKKEEGEEDKEEQEECLDSASSLCLLYILQRFTAETAEVLETEAGWRVFQKALSSASLCLDIHGELMSPQTVLLKEVLHAKFLSSLESQVTQARLWSLLVTRVTTSNDAQEAGRLRHALRRVTLDAEVVVGQIEALQLVPKVTSIKEAREKRIKMRSEDSTHQQAWQKLLLMMETLTVMADLKRPWLLVNPLFNALHLTLTLDLTSTTLLQQQVLSTLLHLLHQSIEELGQKEVARVTQVSVEVVVQVVRASLSHDTQRRALLLLALAAKLVPESVLHNMMAIFTFMGTSLLRRDDAYSFQVIHQTIDAILPTLIKFHGAGVEVRLAQVCQVFVDALPDLPLHRRLPLFTQLANTLQPNSNLWLLLAFLADSHVMRSGGRGGSGEGEDEKHALPQVIQFALNLASEFPASTQLRNCVKLIRLVSSLPDDQDGAKILHQKQQQQQQQRQKKPSYEPKKKKKKMMEIEEEEEMEVEEVQVEEKEVDVTLLPVSSHSQRQIFSLKYTTTALIGHLLASEKFVGKVFEVEEEGEPGEELQGLYQHLLQEAMEFLQMVTSACLLHQDKPAGRLFAALQRKVVEVVERVTALLPPQALLKVTQGLITSAVPLVRAKGAELLAAKLLPSSQAFFRSEDNAALLAGLQTLTAATVDKAEAAENRQTYLFCLQLLTRYLATHSPQPAPKTLQPVLTAAVDVLCDEEEEARVVIQALLVVAEAVAALQVEAVGCLTRLMPALLRLLAAAIAAAAAAATTITTTTTTATTATTTATTTTVTTQLLAVLTALHKVVDSLPQLLSPYLRDVVCQVCLIKPPEEAGTGAKEGKVAGKLATLRESLVKKMEPRVLLPKMDKAFHRLCKKESLWPVQNLVTLVEALVGEVAVSALPRHRPALLTLLTAALDVRHISTATDREEDEVRGVEQATFAALSRLLLRLPEHDNIAIFSSLVTWAAPSTPRRLLAFYRFSAHLAGTYKVLFLAAHLAELLLTPAADLITTINDDPHVFGEDSDAQALTCTLLVAVLDTLTKICAHDSIGFLTHERFDLLCAPLAALLGNEVGGTTVYQERVSGHLSPCLSHLAVAGGDDALWRKLSELVLRYLKEETTRPQVVLGALQVFKGLVEALGEDFLRPLLADIIPPITEAIESTNEEIEAATRSLFTKMEEILGDTLRAYLDF